MSNPTIILVQIIPIIQPIRRTQPPQRHGDDTIDLELSMGRQTRRHAREAHQRAREAQSARIVDALASRGQVALIQESDRSQGARAQRDGQVPCGRDDGHVAQEAAEEVCGQHVAGEVHEVDVREGGCHDGPPGAVAHHVGVVAGHIAHEFDKGALEAGLGLSLGVGAVPEDADVEAHEAVEDALVGGGVGDVFGVGGEESAVGKAEIGGPGEGGV